MRYLLITVCLWICGGFSLNGQDGLAGLLNKYKVTTQLGFQFVSSYTVDQSIYDPDINDYLQVENRLNFQIRRSRLVLKASPYKNVNFKMVTALDFIGRDVLSGEQAGANNGPRPSFSMWDLQINYKMLNNSDGLHLTFGYFHPQFGRAGITPALVDSSFDKPWAQNYVRRLLLGSGPGRAMGLNAGGQFWKKGDLIGLRYDIGLFSPLSYAYDNNSTGISSSSLLTGKIGISIGEPESKKYSTGHKINAFNQRRGLTVGIQGSYQGKTDLFISNNLYGLDLLFNYDHWNIDGQWIWSSRKGAFGTNEFTTESNVKYIRMSYNIGDDVVHMVEPVVTLVNFDGPMNLVKQNEAIHVDAFAGSDTILELGCKFHVSKTLRFMIAYTNNSGEIGDSDPGATFNNYLDQVGVGAIQRGDVIGVSMIMVL